MSDFKFTTNPPKFWRVICEQQGLLFYSRDWQTMLGRSFSSSIIYGWDAKSETGLAITIFKAGGFRVGYVGFPVGGILGQQDLARGCISALRKTHLPSTLHLLRFPVSAFGEENTFELDFAGAPETAIYDLQKWKQSHFPKLNRDIKKANRSGLKVVEASLLPSSGEVCYNLYKDTIQRNNGNLRYNRDYFNGLIELSRFKNPNLRCLLAFLNDEVTGFIVVALHGGTAYYLHGAMNPSYRKYGTSDRLLSEMIPWAKDKGMNCFNLMASPSRQLSLIRYKEKWGGATRTQKVYELSVRPLYAKAFKGTMWCYNNANKFLLRFQR